MPKQLTITSIAKLAGVSAGTVDRILHNRGKVSEAAQAAVEKVLRESKYRNNIHTSAVGLRKGFRITVTVPGPDTGGYWNSILDGVDHALDEFSDISIDCTRAIYSLSDVYSCREVFNSVAMTETDAVIIGPVFTEETLRLCSILRNRKIPYVFVDAEMPGAAPVAAFSADQYACGRLAGRLLSLIAPPPHQKNSLFAFITPHQSSVPSVSSVPERKAGLVSYFSEAGLSGRLKETGVVSSDPAENEKALLEFLEENPDTKGLAVLDSRGYIIADILSSRGIDDISVIAFDLTASNRRCLADKSIQAIICQYPEIQGYNAIKAAIRHLLYREADGNISNKMPVGIIMAENLPWFSKFNGM